MRILFVVTANTIREALRKKFLFGLLTACFLILCLSLLFAQLSLDDKGRLTTDFGLAVVHILLVILSVFFGAGFIREDLERKILGMILTRPVPPSVFFLGRYLGLSFLLFFTLTALSFLLISFFLFLNIPIQLILLYALLGFFFESLLLLAFVLFFSSYASSFLVLFYCFSVFFIGHFVDSFLYFLDKAPPLLSLILSPVTRFIPNLEKVNWKSFVVYQDSIDFSHFAFSSLYIFLWIGLILSVSLFIMEKRDYD